MEAKKAATTGDPSGKEQRQTEQWEKAKKSRIGRKTKHEPIHGTRIYSAIISVIVMHAARPRRRSVLHCKSFPEARRVPAGKQEQERPTSGAYIARGARRPRNCELTAAATSSSVFVVARGTRAPQLCSGFGPVGTSRLATP